MLAKLLLSLLTLFFFTCASTATAASTPAEINAEGINIRSDATANSESICISQKGERIEIIIEAHDWYKITLPQGAPAYVKAKFIEREESVSVGKVLNNRVNIRLAPHEGAPILGKLSKNEIVEIQASKEGWYKIKPTQNTLGWIHKKFVDKKPEAKPGAEEEAPLIKPEAKAEETARAEVKEEAPAKKEEVKLEIKQEAPVVKEEAPAIKEAAVTVIKEEPITQAGEEITLEGIIRPYGKVINRAATHKLETKDKRIYLLKGDAPALESLALRKAKVSGKLIEAKGKDPILEVNKIEVGR